LYFEQKQLNKAETLLLDLLGIVTAAYGKTSIYALDVQQSFVALYLGKEQFKKLYCYNNV